MCQRQFSMGCSYRFRSQMFIGVLFLFFLNMLEAELFSFLENTTDAVFVVTGQGEIRSWNKSAEKLFGYSAAEAKGKTCFEPCMASGPGQRLCVTRTAVFWTASEKNPTFQIST